MFIKSPFEVICETNIQIFIFAASENVHVPHEHYHNQSWRANRSSRSQPPRKAVAHLRLWASVGNLLRRLAPGVGFEPTTNALTAQRSTTELPGIKSYYPLSIIHSQLIKLSFIVSVKRSSSKQPLLLLLRRLNFLKRLRTGGYVFSNFFLQKTHFY